MPDARPVTPADDQRMTNPARLTGSSTLARTAFVAAPAFLFCYGLIRLFNPNRGGPNIGWTSAHIAFLLGLLMFAPALVELRRLAAQGSAGRSRAANTTLVVAFVGLVASVVQAAIDLVVGLREPTHADMSRVFSHIKSFPGAEAAIYTVGPILFFVALAVLGGLLAFRTPRHLPVWSAVLVLIGVVLPSINLDLLPEAAVCLAIAFAPLLRRTAVPVTAKPTATGGSTMAAK
jgi:hypothetical protein